MAEPGFCIRSVHCIICNINVKPVLYQACVLQYVVLYSFYHIKLPSSTDILLKRLESLFCTAPVNIKCSGGRDFLPVPQGDGALLHFISRTCFTTTHGKVVGTCRAGGGLTGNTPSGPLMLLEPHGVQQAPTGSRRERSRHSLDSLKETPFHEP